MEFKVLQEGVINQAGETAPVGSIITLDPSSTATSELIAKGSIEAVIPADIEMEEYTLTQEDIDTNPTFTEQGLVAGDVIKQIKAPIAIDTDSAPAEIVKEESAPAEELKSHYHGQVVILESIRTVNERDFHHIRIADGSEYDLTDEEYETEVKLA